eukprot:6953881-Pyramimonas_sp.AAC.1
MHQLSMGGGCLFSAVRYLGALACPQSTAKTAAATTTRGGGATAMATAMAREGARMPSLADAPLKYPCTTIIAVTVIFAPSPFSSS